jgi:hypothetical protein
MKKFTNFLAFFLLVNMLHAQTQVELNTQFNGSWKDVKLKAVCPLTDVTFQIVGYKAGCHTVTYSNTSGTPSPSSSGELTVQIQDTGDSTFIDVKADGGGCSTNDRTGKKFFIPVLSLKKTQPELTLKSGNLDVGFIQDPVEFVARTKWPFLGTEDDATKDPLKFKIFDWNWNLAGWTKLSGGQQDSNIVFKTNIGGGGFLYARVHNPACEFGDKSMWDTLEVKRTIESPCPIKATTQDYELCGTPSLFRFNCDTMKAGYTENSLLWTWSVSPTNGITNQQQLDNAYRYNSDGSNARTVTVIVSDYGVSSNCTLQIPKRVINPTAQVNGPSLLCDPGVFGLTHTAAAGATVTWKVSSTAPNTLSPVSPSTGSGQVANVSPNGFGEATIEFTITGCGLTTKLQKTFFTGKPLIKPLKIDGKLLHSGMNYVCPDNIEGSHYITVNPFGDTDGWVDSFQITGAGVSWQGGTNELDFTLQYTGVGNPPYSCAFIQAFASNDCGTTNAVYVVCPSYWACNDNPWFLRLSPNPADDQTNVTLNLKGSDGSTSVVKMDKFEVIDKTGNLIQEIEPDLDEYWLNTSNFPDGTYFIRTFIEGSPLMELFIVEHGQ